MNGKTKSILMQVAFYGVSYTNPQPTQEQVESNFNLLLNLHEKFGIEPDEGGNRGGGGFRKSSAPSTPAVGGTLFVSGGESWIDYRPAKASGEVKENFPDFKTADNKKSVWLYDRDGGPNAEAAPLVAAADAAEVF